MTQPGPIWRAILWIERFLPAPAPVRSVPERPSTRRRLATMWPLLVYPAIVLMTLFSRRYAVNAMAVKYHVVLEELSLVAAGCVVLAIIGFGVKAWRDAKAGR